MCFRDLSARPPGPVASPWPAPGFLLACVMACSTVSTNSTKTSLCHLAEGPLCVVTFEEARGLAVPNDGIAECFVSLEALGSEQTCFFCFGGPRFQASPAHCLGVEGSELVKS